MDCEWVKSHQDEFILAAVELIHFLLILSLTQVYIKYKIHSKCLAHVSRLGWGCAPNKVIVYFLSRVLFRRMTSHFSLQTSLKIRAVLFGMLSPDAILVSELEKFAHGHQPFLGKIPVSPFVRSIVFRSADSGLLVTICVFLVAPWPFGRFLVTLSPSLKFFPKFNQRKFLPNFSLT